MTNRKLYKLEKSNGSIIVYRTDNNYGRQGVVYCNSVRFEYTPFAIPKYIIKESRAILKACKFELKRGYTYSGQPCLIG